ncbi:MAG TPA: hypothetical protein PK379_02810 [Candidatus Hydrogenedentes bacterium]|nr:hypothetical protein [Candidatus Hydrogenedentota bacterium]HOJ68055.1 hypothetical protein [Candidatus Hydrogenedentota bacterium]HOK88936.1 hypothetical protein [Candidatus Hydrogenedentota bacterium]
MRAIVPIHKHGSAFPEIAVTLCLLGLATLSSAVAQIQVTPEQVTFEHLDQSQTLQIRRDGAPVPAEDIVRFELLVDRSDYSHMFRFEKANGQVILTPSKTCEVGSYLLRIATRRGDGWVRVYTPLRDHPSTLELLAQRLGITVDELKQRAGIAQVISRQRISLDLPPVYYVGNVISVDMRAAPGNTWTWEINGTVVTENQPLRYVVSEPGPLLLVYTEKQGDLVVAKVSELTEAAVEPELSTTVKAGVDLILNAPEGFGAYRWTQDGRDVSADRTYTFRMDAPGTYKVEVLASRPLTGDPDAFRRIRYAVRVEPR